MKATTSTTTAELQPGLLYFGLGANLGDRESTLCWALQALARRYSSLRVAGLYRSAPVVDPAGSVDQPDYLNPAAVGRLERPLPARAVLADLKRLEHQAGRDLGGPKDGPRPLDIDLLLAGAVTLDLGPLSTPSPAPLDVDAGPWPGHLTLPHPRLAERRFVLQPLFDLAPDLVIPTRGASVRELLTAFSDRQEVASMPWSAPPLAHQTTGRSSMGDGDPV